MLEHLVEITAVFKPYIKGDHRNGQAGMGKKIAGFLYPHNINIVVEIVSKTFIEEFTEIT
jgi:hypothetical protein